MGAIFDAILYRPMFNALVALYQVIPGGDFGVTIIVLTCLIRTVLFIPTLKSIKAQKALQELQPRIKELQERYKDDKMKQGQEVMKLYKEEKINPFSGCLPVLIQLPIIIALFLVLRNLSGDLNNINFEGLYSFVSAPESISPTFLGILDLTKASPVLAVLAGALQFVQSKMMLSKNKKVAAAKTDFSQLMQKQMLYFFPFFTILILWRLQSAIGLYWMTSILFSIGQQYIAFRPKNVNLTRNQINPGGS